MALIPYHVVHAFVAGRKDSAGAFATDGKAIYSYAMRLAHKDASGNIVYDYVPLVHGSKAPTVTTARHMKALESVCQPPPKAKSNPSSGSRHACRCNPAGPHHCGARANPAGRSVLSGPTRLLPSRWPDCWRVLYNETVWLVHKADRKIVGIDVGDSAVFGSPSPHVAAEILAVCPHDRQTGLSVHDNPFSAKMQRSIKFFAEHAAYATPPGRMACARDLAKAEAEAEDRDWTIDWQNDPEGLSWVSKEDEQERIEKGVEVLMCTLRDRDGNVLASLGGIDGPSREYKRVVEAELAQEALGIIEQQVMRRNPADKVDAILRSVRGKLRLPVGRVQPASKRKAVVEALRAETSDKYVAVQVYDIIFKGSDPADFDALWGLKRNPSEPVLNEYGMTLVECQGGCGGGIWIAPEYISDKRAHVCVSCQHDTKEADRGKKLTKAWRARQARARRNPVQGGGQKHPAERVWTAHVWVWGGKLHVDVYTECPLNGKSFFRMGAYSSRKELEHALISKRNDFHAAQPDLPPIRITYEYTSGAREYTDGAREYTDGARANPTQTYTLWVKLASGTITDFNKTPLSAKGITRLIKQVNASEFAYVHHVTKGRKGANVPIEQFTGRDNPAGRRLLKCETDTPSVERQVLAAAGQALGSRRSLQADFEHGQWWITNVRTGAQWSVHDTTGGFGFEQVTQGDYE